MRFRPTPSGRMVAGYDLDANRVVLPDEFQDRDGLSYRQRRSLQKRRKLWMEERGLVPAIGGSAGYGSSFLQMLEPFQVIDSTTLSTSVTETAISSGTLMTLPPNFFGYPGKQAWLRAMGKMSNTAAAVTITFRVRYDVTAPATPPVGTILCASGAITCNAVVCTDGLWYIEAWLNAIATGPAATSLTLLTYGECFVANTGAAAADIRNASMPAGTIALGNVANLDGTTGKALTVSAQWGTSNAGNAITVRNCFIVALN